MATQYLRLEDWGPRSEPRKLLHPVVPAGTITRNATGQLVPYAAAAHEASQAPAPSMTSTAQAQTPQPATPAPQTVPSTTPAAQPATPYFYSAARDRLMGIDRGLVQDEQGRWSPGEALQQTVEANYQAGIAARNPVTSASVVAPSQSELLDKELEKYDTPTTGMGALALLAGAKANVDSQFTADEAAKRAKEKQQDIGLRGIATGLQAKELELKAQEAPTMRELREAQTQQAMAEGAFTREKTKMYPETIAQSQLAAQEKATGASLGKIQSNIFKLETELRQAITPEQKDAIRKAIANQKLQYEALLK